MDVLNHVLIAGFYFVLPLAISALSFLLHWRHPWEMFLFAGSMTVFFVGCGLHHIDMLTHILDHTPIDSPSLHHTGAGVMQVGGALVALIVLSFNLRRWLDQGAVER